MYWSFILSSIRKTKLHANYLSPFRDVRLIAKWNFIGIRETLADAYWGRKR